MIDEMVNTDYRTYIKDITSSKYKVVKSKKPSGENHVGTYRKMTVD